MANLPHSIREKTSCLFPENLLPKQQKGRRKTAKRFYHFPYCILTNMIEDKDCSFSHFRMTQETDTHIATDNGTLRILHNGLDDLKAIKSRLTMIKAV